TFDYKTDRSYDARVFGTTIQYMPTYRAIGIGQYLGRGAPIDFRWRPYVGLVWEKVKAPGSVDAYAKLTSFTHEFIRTTGEIKLWDYWKITPEVTVWHGSRTKADGSISHWQALSTAEFRWI